MIKFFANIISMLLGGEPYYDGGYRSQGKSIVIVELQYSSADKIKIKTLVDSEKGIINIDFKDEEQSVEVKYWRGLIDGLIIKEKIEALGFIISNVKRKQNK